MKPIGGYFSLETGQTHNNPFTNLVALNSSRHALEYILCQMDYIPERVYLPYFTCKVVLEPLQRLNIPYSFYKINENFEISKYPELGAGEYIIVNNYFGVKDQYIDALYKRYGEKLIIDNAQALFHPNVNGSKVFYSPRKFVGLPDGGFAKVDINRDIPLDLDYSTDRCSHLFRRIDSGAESGYNEFKHNDDDLSKVPMRRMSNLTKFLIGQIDFVKVRSRRLANYQILEDALKFKNQIILPELDTFACPMVYPFLTNNSDLKNRLIANKVFVATYWPNVFEWCPEHSVEYSLAMNLLPLPIDQRYDESDMKRIIDLLK